MSKLHKSDRIVIRGGDPIYGDVFISGAKNAAVAIIPAALLVDGWCRIENVPKIKDVEILKRIISEIGAKVEVEDNDVLYIDASGVCSHVATYEMVKGLRASYYLLGALLGKLGRAEVYPPGGCDFGFRPIDQHIKGFEVLGAEMVESEGIVTATAEALVGNTIYLDIVSVGATLNLMMAAVKARGTTYIENAAREPHVVDVANFLNAMGAYIRGAGTDRIRIRGVEKLPGNAVYTIIPDQIEAGTFMIAAAATGGDVCVRNIIPKHMESLSAKLSEIGVSVTSSGDWIRVKGERKLRHVNVKTMPYPGFPTDLQPQISTLLTQAEGTSSVTEGIWNDRFQYVHELNKMGARIKLEGKKAVITGGTPLRGTKVIANDLRAGAAIVIAGMMAEGITELSQVSNIERGYEDFVAKLNSLGATIEYMTDFAAEMATAEV